jgi:hypothetical protein
MKKLKKLNLLRPEIEVEFSRPILGRLLLFFRFPSLCKIFKANICVNVAGRFGLVDCGRMTLAKVWYICIPKIKVVDCVE